MEVLIGTCCLFSIFGVAFLLACKCPIGIPPCSFKEGLSSIIHKDARRD